MIGVYVRLINANMWTLENVPQYWYDDVKAVLDAQNK